MRAYWRLLRTPDATRIVVSLLLGGTAGAMAPVSLVLFAREATNSFATASLVLAALTAGRLTLAPWRGRLVDRQGPSRALLLLGPPVLVTDVLFILVGRAQPAPALLIAIAGLSGAVSASPWTAVRSVWVTLLADDAQRRTGLALMSVIAEVNFFTGPLLAGILIALGSPTLAVATAAGLTIVGTLILALTPAARAVPGRPPASGTGRLPALAGTAIRYVVGTSGLFGLTFGLLDVAWPAFARHHGSAVAAGVFLSLFAAGAGVGGLLYGARRRVRTAVSLYPRVCLLATVGLVPVLAATSVGPMALAAVLAGACFAPMSTVQTAAVEEVGPAGHRAEAYNWLGTVYGAGSALGAATAGQLIVSSGTRAAFGGAALATATAWLIIFARRRVLIADAAAVRAAREERTDTVGR
jgi:MFS family permease